MQQVFSILISFGLSIVVWAGETISEGQLAKGTKWETPFYVRVNGQDGPTVVITGGIHGNEPAGARAAEQIRHWPITCGRLVVIPQANIPGLRDGTRFYRANRRHAVISTGNSPRPRWQPRRMAYWARNSGSLSATKIPIG